MMLLGFACISAVFLLSLMKTNNILSLLLSLESLVLVFFLVMISVNELLFAVIFLSVAACEAAIGIGCLVNFIRGSGSSFLLFREYGFSI